MTISYLDVHFCEFDLDGTLVNSIQSIEGAWGDFLKTHPKLNENGDFYHKTHGVRVLDIYRTFIPEEFSNDKELELAAAKFDNSIASVYGHFGKPIPGGPLLTQSLEKLPNSPWCIVTSGSKILATSWFDNVLTENGYAKPEIFITADDVKQGKPNPEGYNLGCQILTKKLKLDTESVIKRVVFEDAPLGLKAGIDSGAKTIAITTTFDAEHLYSVGADYVIDDLTKVKVYKFENGIITLEIDHFDK